VQFFEDLEEFDPHALFGLVAMFIASNMVYNSSHSIKRKHEDNCLMKKDSNKNLLKNSTT
jgi:hypothetical protein